MIVWADSVWRFVCGMEEKLKKQQQEGSTSPTERQPIQKKIPNPNRDIVSTDGDALAKTGARRLERRKYIDMVS